MPEAHQGVETMGAWYAVLLNLPCYPTREQTVSGSCFTEDSFTWVLRNQASALPSTGVLPVRGTPGQPRQIKRCVEVAVKDLTTLRAAEDRIRECQVVVHPAAGGTRLAGRLPPRRQPP